MRRRDALRVGGSAGTFLLALVSVVLAWAVWFIVRQEVRDEEVFTVTVEARVEDAPNLNATMLPDSTEVKLTIAGPKGDVAAVRASGDRSAVVYVGADDIRLENKDAVLTFELRDLHFGALAFVESTEAIEMDPPKLKVKVRRFGEKLANVLPPPLKEEHPGFRLDIVRLPAQGRVRGPLSALDAYADLATALNRDQLARAIERMEDDPQLTVSIDLLPVRKSETVFAGDDVELLEKLVASVKITHLETVSRWVELSIVVSESAGVPASTFRFSSVNRTNLGEDAWVGPGRDGKPARALLAFRGAPKKLELLPDPLVGLVWVDGLVKDGSPAGGRAPVDVFRMPTGVTFEKLYEVDIEIVP